MINTIENYKCFIKDNASLNLTSDSLVGVWCKDRPKGTEQKNYGYQLKLYPIEGNKNKPPLVNKEIMNKFLNSNLPEKTLYFGTIVDLGNYASTLNISLFHIG